MNPETTTTTEAPVAAPTAAPVAASATAAPARLGFNSGPRGQGGAGAPRDGQGGFRKNRREGAKREPRAKPEYDQKILNIRRVTRVASGGRRFSFSVAIVIGNRKGSVGVGTGKAGDTSLAIDKAVKNAKKNLLTLNLTKSGSIRHDVEAKFGSARVLLMPAKGRGIVAGSAVRDMVELGGIKDINAKILSGSKNKLNIARAMIKALDQVNVAWRKGAPKAGAKAEAVSK